MFDFLRGNRPLSLATLVSSVLLAQGVLAPAASGADVQTGIADARAAADAGNYALAFSKGIAALEAHPESQWDRATLEKFILIVSDDWFVRMASTEKQAALGSLDSIQSPAAKTTRAYGKWKQGQRAEAVTEWKAVVDQHPDSVGAFSAIYAYLIANWNRLSNASAKSEISSIVQAAPNNAGGAWAITRLTWRLGARGRFTELRQFYTQITDARPGTLCADVVSDLGQMLDAIDAADYASAFARLGRLRDYLRSATKASMIIDTFFKGIDWESPGNATSRIAALQQLFTSIADNEPDGELRCFAIAVLARILEKQGRKTDAADELQRIVDTGGPNLLKSYAVSRIGQLVRVSDPDRAIAALEMHRMIESPNRVAGIEHSMITLGRLYVGKGQHDKAEELFGWLLDEARSGEFLFTDLEEHVAAGLTAALRGQGKNAEADSVLGP